MAIAVNIAASIMSALFGSLPPLPTNGQLQCFDDFSDYYLGVRLFLGEEKCDYL